MTARAKSRLTLTLLVIQLVAGVLCFVSVFNHWDLPWVQWSSLAVFTVAMLGRYAVRFLVPLTPDPSDSDNTH